MENNKKSKKSVLIGITSLFLVTLILLGLTYAYYRTRIIENTNTKSISVVAKNLSLVYKDGTNKILTADQISPGMVVGTKDFTVTNDGDEDLEYEVYLENVYNDFKYVDDIKLTITCTSTFADKTTGTCYGYDDIYPSTNTRLITNSIKAGEVQSYVLTVEYIESNTDQSDDMGKTIEGKIQIYDAKDVFAISGTIEGYDPSYFVELHSDVKTSQISSNGSFVFYGVEPGTHYLFVKSNTSEGIEEIGSATIQVDRGTTSNIEGDASNIVINDDSYNATINITIPESKDSISLEGVSVKDLNPYDEGTLAYSVINNALYSDSENSTVYSFLPLTKVAAEINGVTERTLSEERDVYTSTTGNNSFYYRGNVLDNYVDFAEMCWRIVRIEGDGSAKLILEDQDNTCASSNGNFDINVGNFGYTEYGVGALTASDGTTNTKAKYIGDYLGGKTNASASMASAFKAFQTSLDTKISSKYSEQDLSTMLKSGNWCIEDKLYSRTRLSNLYYVYTLIESKNQILDYKIKGTTMYYDSGKRLNNQNNEYYPTLKCNGTIMNFWGDTTGDNNMYVGTLTADEIVYAGASYNKDNKNLYLMNEYSIRTETCNDDTGEGHCGVEWFSLSNGLSRANVDDVFTLSYDGDLYIDYVNDNSVFRPSISLKSGVEIASGNGTKTEPYVVK